MSAGHHVQLCAVMALDAPVKARELFDGLSKALRGPAAERLVVTTTTGALVAFRGDPRDALATAIALRQSIDAARVGMSLGAVEFTSAEGVPPALSGEPVDAAHRLSVAAKPGQILADELFYRVVSRLAAEHGVRLSAAGAEAYEISDASALPRIEEPVVPRSTEPAKIFDAGQNLVISGSSREAVEAALARLAGDGARIVSDIAQVGAKWMATATHADSGGPAETARVEEAGLMRIVTGPTREAVEEKVEEMTAVGARLVSPIELHEGKWTAVCDFGGER
jgi:hypothetical protein